MASHHIVTWDSRDGDDFVVDAVDLAAFDVVYVDALAGPVMIDASGAITLTTGYNGDDRAPDGVVIRNDTVLVYPDDEQAPVTSVNLTTGEVTQVPRTAEDERWRTHTSFRALTADWSGPDSTAADNTASTTDSAGPA